MARYTHGFALVVMGMLAVAPRVEAQASLAAARELYASAEYAPALNMLEGLLVREQSREQKRAIELYRTLCLVAIGRSAEAESAIEAMILQDPLYRPPADDLPPRMRSAFSDARKRLLPTIIQQRYLEAKAAFDRQDFQRSAAGFQQVLEGLADGDVAAVSTKPPLSDLKTLASGFHDLSVKSLAPPEPPPAPEPEPAPAVPQAPRIYSGDDANVIAPVTVRQQIPPFPGKIIAAGQAVMEVIIDERGTVESVVMRVPLNAMYDKHAMKAAMNWQYQPAMKAGTPVKFRKMVQINLKPTPRED